MPRVNGSREPAFLRCVFGAMFIVPIEAPDLADEALEIRPVGRQVKFALVEFPHTSDQALALKPRPQIGL